MRRLARAIGALSLTLCAAGAVVLAPAPADAQGKGRKSGQHNEKQYRKELKRQYKQDRRAIAHGRDDDRDDRDRRRYADRYADRYESRNRAVTTGSYGSRAVPRGHLPPPGLCRIWIDGVPPGRQPRATDCATARRNRPANARILYGGDVRRTRDAYDRRVPVYDGRDDRRDDRSDVRYPIDTRTRDPQFPMPRRTIPLP